MPNLVLALYAEGRTDDRFLPIIIHRTAESVLARRGRTVVDVLEPGVLDHTDGIPDRAHRILDVARQATGYHALIVHADADAPDRERAYNERYKPGHDLVHSTADHVCRRLLPIIPVRITEAWMLADPNALCEVIGTNERAENLGLPDRPHQVESDVAPKQRLADAIQRALQARPRRHRRVDVASIYEPLARRINLEHLGLVPAYRQFVDDLTQTLVELRLAE